MFFGTKAKHCYLLVVVLFREDQLNVKQNASFIIAGLMCLLIILMICFSLTNFKAINSSQKNKNSG